MQDHLSTWLEMAAGFAPQVLQAILTLIIGFWIAGKLAAMLSKVLGKKKVDPTIVPFLVSIVSVLFKVLVLISVAGIFGIETTSFVAILASAGLAVGLALQGSLGHFASGVLILTFRPYKTGDLVTIGGFTGEVEQIQVFNTILRTPDNKRIIVPNGVVTSGPVTNISGQGTIRVDMQFSVSSSENIDKVKEVIREVSATSRFVLNTPQTDILVHGQEVGVTKFDVRPWCKSEHYWDTYYEMQENIKRQFESKGIKPPKPSMDLAVTNS